MNTKIAPSVLTYLDGLKTADQEIANTWRPDDPAYVADTHRQTLMNFSYAYFAFFHADPEHPDWAPLWNPVYTHQPNPDDIYLYSPLRGDLTYRVAGNRGTVKKLIFVTQHGKSGLVDDVSEVHSANDIDETGIKVGPDGEFELIFSAERPAGYTGNWAPMPPKANLMMVRYRMYDWVKERDPQLTIECLSPVPPKKRLTPDEVLARIKQMTLYAGRASKLFNRMQNGIKERAGINTFEPVKYIGLSKQVYWPAVFELDDGEALIIETDMPKSVEYWNIQLNDPYFNAVEYVYRLSSTNGAMAKISSDGKLRAVIALVDPGVPNWLDPADYKEGTIYGRWYGADSNPLPIIKRVPLAKLRDHLPKDTPVVTPAQRAEELRARVLAAQRRRRW